MKSPNTESHGSNRPTVPMGHLMWILISGALVWASLRISAGEELLSSLTKPIILALVRAAGFAASDMGSHLEVGALHVPWTGDCSGASILSVLLAAILWSRRTRRLDIGLLLRLALAFPLAYLCNIARILSLLCYRAAFYPAVETPAIHYFVGFLWVLPVLPLLLRSSSSGGSLSLAGMIHLCASLALVAPLIDEPGGWLITAATLILLIPNFESHRSSKRRPIEIVLWLIAAVWILGSSMESLWLPWLLINPWTYHCTSKTNWMIYLIALGTLPIVAMRPAAQIVLSLLLLWQLRTLLQQTKAPPQIRFAFSSRCSLWLIPLFCLPLLAPKLHWTTSADISPPSSVQSVGTSNGPFQIKLLGQPRTIALNWFSPQGDGRHHNLKQCLLFRGVEIQPSKAPGVWTDGEHWLTESFLVNAHSVQDYKAYLFETFLPFSHPGVHLVFVCKQQSMSADQFKRHADSLTQRLAHIIKADQSGVSAWY